MWLNNMPAEWDDLSRPDWSYTARFWLKLYDLIVFVGALFFNIVLGALAITERNQILRDYAKILFIICANDFCFNLVEFFFQMIIEIDNDAVIYFSRKNYLNDLFGPSENFRFLNQFLWMIFVVPLSLMPTLVFIFRYMLIVKRRKMSNRAIGGFVAFVFLNTLIQAIIWTYSGKESTTFKCQQLLHGSPWSFEERGNCIIMYLHDPLMVNGLRLGIAHDIFVYATVIFCTLSIFRVTKSRDINHKSREAQCQVNRILFIQMCLPFLFIIAPLSVIVTFGSLHVHPVGIGFYITPSFKLLPLLSPLSTIAFVANFRRRFVCAFLTVLGVRQIFPSLNSVPTMPQTETPNKQAPVSIGHFPASSRQQSVQFK